MLHWIRKSASHTVLKCVLPTLGLITSACIPVDRVDDRTTDMNLAISEAANRSTLLNIVRASEAEPLSFAALASFQGHNTLQGTLAAPSIGLTGNQLRVQSLSVSTPSVNGTVSNDFSYLSSNDKATFEALLQPIKPAVAAYFLRQDYKRDVLFLLMISKIKIRSRGGEEILEFDPDEFRSLTNETVDNSRFVKFADKLQLLIQGGLTAELDDITNRKSKVCFDPALRLPYPVSQVRKVSFSPTCKNAKIVTETDPDPKKSDSHLPFRTGYAVLDKENGTEIELIFRSTYGIYNFIGGLVRNNVDLGILSKESQEPGDLLVNILGNSQNCFVEQYYRGKRFCVPETATTTKRIFSLLNNLVRLYTVPQVQAQPTLTARLIGQ